MSTRKRQKYEKEFKEMIVSLVNSGQSRAAVSKDYHLDSGMVGRWVRESKSGKEAFTGNGNPSMTPQEKEISALRKELKEAQIERDILKKAVSIFSKSDRTNTSL